MTRRDQAQELRTAARGDLQARLNYLRLASTPGLVEPETAADYRQRARECRASCARNIAEARLLENRRRGPSEPRPPVGGLW